MSYCTPCPPCDTEFPLLCEPLEITTQAKRLVVEDTAACQKTLQTPSSSQQILKSVGGNLSWTSGGNNSVLTKDNNGVIELKNGSVSEPIILPNIAQHTASSVPSQLVMLSDGTVKIWEPSLTSDKYIAYWDGSNWQASNIDSFLPTGNGVFFRDTSGALQVAVAGVSGSTLQMVGSNIQFVPTSSNQLAQGYLYGLTLSNASSDLNNSITVSQGKCRNEQDTADMILTSQITKDLNQVWAQGNNNGGMDISPKTGTQHYHAYLISDGTNFDVIFSISASGPSLPGGYTAYRRIGCVTTEASGAIRQFSQIGDRFIYTGKPIAAQSNIGLTLGGQLVSLYGTVAAVPQGIRVRPIFRWVTSASQAAVADTDATYFSTQIPGANNTTANTFIGSTAAATSRSVFDNGGFYTNTLGQLFFDVSATTTQGTFIDVHGWWDDRGRI